MKHPNMEHRITANVTSAMVIGTSVETMPIEVGTNWVDPRPAV